MLAAVWLAFGSAIAVEPLGLYQGMAFTTGMGEEAQRTGFAAAFEEVLAKVSGDHRLIGDPGVEALGEHAADYVESFSFRDRMEGIPTHDEQGTRERPHDLTVTFNPEKIDAALRNLGREPWPEPRPMLVLVARVEFGEPFVLTEDSSRGADMRTALDIVAARVGLEVILPSTEQLAESAASFGELPEGDGTALDALAAEAGADLALVGTLIWSDEALGWIAEWRLDFEDETCRYGVSGVSFDAAFRNALRGAAQIMSGNGVPK
jgi:hypothetical protein